MLRKPRCAVAVLQVIVLLLLCDAGFGRAQLVFPLAPAVPMFAADLASRYVQPSGKTVYVGRMGLDGPSYAIGVARTNQDGTPDAAFGKNGLVELAVFGFAEVGTVVVAPNDGSLLIGANVVDPTGTPLCIYWSACNNYIALFRITSDGREDMSFNRSGRLVMHIGDVIPGADEPGMLDRRLIRLSLLPDGSIEIKGSSIDYETPLPVIAHVHANGELDTSFVRADNGDAAREVNLSVAMEFYNAALGKFFVTADVNEIMGLRRNEHSGWTWYGGAFHVISVGAVWAGVPVCRFYGRPEAGLDSHVLSANSAECQLLESAGGETWILESRSTFRAGLPDLVTGECPPGQAPVYRLWNGRADGGHHLTSTLKIRTALLNLGYIAEGWGPDGVAMCAAP